jgi:hypothetical protein
MVAVECGEVPGGLVGRDTGERGGVGVDVDTGMKRCRSAGRYW